jgi:hypothetical protein
VSLVEHGRQLHQAVPQLLLLLLEFLPEPLGPEEVQHALHHPPVLGLLELRQQLLLLQQHLRRCDTAGKQLLTICESQWLLSMCCTGMLRVQPVHCRAPCCCQLQLTA